MSIRQLDDRTYIGAQVHPEEVAGLAQMGVTLIVNNRPDGEDSEQPLGAQIEEAASAAGIDYRAVPIVRGIGPSDAEAIGEAIASAKGKTLLFCRSGNRSALAWAVSQSDRGVNREEIEAKLLGVGIDPSAIAHLL
jgi:uncharacterized protein (TIGR01244 family)